MNTLLVYVSAIIAFILLITLTISIKKAIEGEDYIYYLIATCFLSASLTFAVLILLAS